MRMRIFGGEVRMKKTVLAAIAATALGGTAMAADLPMRSGPVMAPIAPMFTWTGFYVGVNAGMVFSDNNITTTGTAPFTIGNVAALRRPPSISMSDESFTIGGQIGYNYQVGNLVFGIETDIAWVDGSKRVTNVGTSNATSVFTQELDYLGTIRARLGFAFDRALIYATGGLAYGDVTNRANFLNAATGTTDYIGGRSSVQWGYAVGAGVEYAFTNALSAKVEYLYYDLGRKNVGVNQVNFALAPGSYASRFDNSGHIVRAGLNYRFSTY